MDSIAFNMSVAGILHMLRQCTRFTYLPRRAGREGFIAAYAFDATTDVSVRFIVRRFLLDDVIVTVEATATDYRGHVATEFRATRPLADFPPEVAEHVSYALDVTDVEHVTFGDRSPATAR